MLGLEVGMVNGNTTTIPLQDLQNKFAIIDLSGEIRVVDLQQIAAILQGTLPGDPSFYKKVDATLKMKRVLETLPCPSKPEVVINDFWISPATRVYRGTAFTPSPTVPDLLNYWVEPHPPDSAGDASVILRHLFEVLCNSDQACYDYLVAYLAHMIQKPTEKPGVMIVLLGGQGTGKGMFFQLLRAIWPRTTLQVTDIDQVIGRFNACLERNYVVCMDEALFAGDRKATDRLKSLVTEPHINIEQKYQPARCIDSIHRFFAASNHSHFSQVDSDDRRFIFLKVSNAHQQDSTYFGRLATAIDDPTAIGAFVNHLENIDLTSFDVRKKPQTKEHQEQKLKSLQGFDRYWFEVLVAGDFAAGQDLYYCNSSWSEATFIPTESLIKHYTMFNKNAQRYQTVQSTDIISAVKKLCPCVTVRRKVWEQSVATKAQKRGLQLPDLATARSEFEAAIGGSIEWH